MEGGGDGGMSGVCRKGRGGHCCKMMSFPPRAQRLQDNISYC